MLIPRSGNFLEVTRMDLWLMQCIMAKRKPNLSLLIVNHMIDSFRGNKRSLPQGMALSNLLEKEVGGLEGAKKVYLNLAQHINSNTAMGIGFVAQEGGTWVRGKVSKKQKTITPVEPSSIPT